MIVFETLFYSPFNSGVIRSSLICLARSDSSMSARLFISESMISSHSFILFAVPHGKHRDD